jgi:hypothetical protein
MSKENKQSIDTKYEYQQIARERAIWVLKPIALVVMVMWCFHPATVKSDVLRRNCLAGFLMGCAYSMFINRETLRYYLITRRQEKRDKRNEMPDDYYFGDIVEWMDAGGKK